MTRVIKNRFTGAVLFTGESGMTTRQMLEKANLTGANLMDASLMDADLRGADLRGANLTGADLRGANLMDANLTDASLRGADLRGANLTGADLRGANLMDASLTGADLRDADLTGANLMSASFTGANLMDANLRGANLMDASLRGADLRDADLTGANLTGANLMDADGKTLHATDAESIESLDKVRAIILDDQARLEMGHWHGGNEWADRTCAEEAVCGTTHCLAGWLQVCSTNPDIRKLDAELAGIMSAPVAAKMFYKSSEDVLPWLESRAYVAELAFKEPV